MLPKVDIIMATYNGEKYIENQILSLMQQNHKNWHLIIHDDGSTDNTLQIIKNCMKQDDRITLIDDGITGLKVGKNFLHALSFSSSEYAIFCDQDDIWLETKISELLQLMLKKENKDKPSLVYCDGYPWSNDGEIGLESISPIQAKNIKDIILLNAGYQGCSMLMNRKLIDITLKYEGYVYHHDDIVTLFAYAFGDIYFLPRKLMLYRQHFMAVTGNKNYKKKPLGGLLNNVGFTISKDHYNEKKDFFDCYKDSLTPNRAKVFNEYFRYCEAHSKIQKIKLILTQSLTWDGSKIKLLGKTLFQRGFDK